MKMSEEMEGKYQELLDTIQLLEDATFELEQMIKQAQPSLLGEYFFTDEELSTMLKVNRRTLQVWRSEGVIEYIQIGGGKVIYSSSAIEALLRRNVFPVWEA